MKLKTLSLALAGTCAALGLSAASAADYLIGTNNGQNRSLASEIARAGGTLEKTFPFGLAIASSDNPMFADNLYDISNVQFVAEDTGFDVHYGERVAVGDFANPPASGDDDFFFDLQWGHKYVSAAEAWNKGVRGAGVTVAVLDGGFDVTQPDLSPNIVDTADMTGQGLAYCPSTPADPFSHGSHVAGTIAAADNAFGTIGVAPEASLMLVKVLNDVPLQGGGCTGSGSFANIIEGIVYATDNYADVINMSLGATIARQGLGGINADLSALQNAVNKAITYAHQNGTTVIVSAGNDAQDLDGGDRSAVRFNTGMSHAVGISALAPSGFYLNPDQDLELASYSNYGTSMVDFGAPGGDIGYPGDELCTVAGITAPCFVMDLVFSVGNGGWYWSAGTSMSSPHAAGIAALIISETGDSTPSHVIREMRRRAVENGKPGRDDDNGHGIANSGH